MMPPPPPMNTNMAMPGTIQEEDDDDVSDIISVSGDSTGGEVRRKSTSVSKPKRDQTKEED